MNEIDGLEKAEMPYCKAFAWGGIWLALLTMGFTLAYGHFAAVGFGRLPGLTMFPSAVYGYRAIHAPSWHRPMGEAPIKGPESCPKTPVGGLANFVKTSWPETESVGQ